MKSFLITFLVISLACLGQVNVRTPSNTDAVARPAGQRAIYCYSNPAVDDSPAIHAAMSSGSILMMPAGQTCHLNLGGDNKLVPGVKMIGIPGLTVLEPFRKGKPIIDVNGMDASRPVTDITIEGITFDADAAPLEGDRAGLVSFRFVSNLRFVNNILRSSGGPLNPGEALRLVNTNGLISDNDISGAGTLIEMYQDNPGYLPGGDGPMIVNNKLHDNSSGQGGGDAVYIHGNDNFSSQKILTLNYTVSPFDKSYLTTFSNRAGVSVKLPAAGARNNFPDGWGARYLNSSGGGNVVFQVDGSQINGSSTYTLMPGLGVQIYTPDGKNYVASATNAQTGSNYSVSAADCENAIAVKPSGSMTVTLPASAPAAACGFGFGFRTRIVNLGTGTANVTASGGSTIDGKPSIALASGQSAELTADGANYSATQDFFHEPFQPSIDFPVLVSGNSIRNIHTHEGDSGATGNGIHAYHAVGIRIEGNTVSSPDYSCIRASSSDDTIAIGNYCYSAGETALYSEYSGQGNIWQGNVVNGAGACLLSPSNFNSSLGDTKHVAPGKLSIIQGNRLKNCAGRGISAEAFAEISDNIIEHTGGAAIQIGYGSFEQNVHVHHNMIVGATPIGICIEHGRNSLNHIVEDNMFDLPAGVPHIAACDHEKLFKNGALQSGVLVRNETIPRAMIGTPDNGSFLYIPDAAPGGNCTTPGSGAFGRRAGGNWSCS